MRETLEDVIAALPVYRTYVAEAAIEDEDRGPSRCAAELACGRAGGGEPALVDAIAAALDRRARRGDEVPAAHRVGRGESDRRHRALPLRALASLNEVGGAPQRFGTTVAAFHRFNERAAAHRPFGMLATATHDHKRGEDARLRVDALAEMPERWSESLRALDAPATPDRNDVYALYQTLLATWPAERGDAPPPDGLAAYLDRIEGWLRKAMREAKVHTAGAHPQPAYEDGAVAYLRRLFEPGARAAFMRHFAPLARDVAMIAAISSLAQTALKMTSPGVPDLYQGCELWDLSLVDPDNRRPVDYALRARYLREMRARLEGRERLALTQELLRSWRDGRIKLFVTHQLLHCANGTQRRFSAARIGRFDVAVRSAADSLPTRAIDRRGRAAARRCDPARSAARTGLRRSRLPASTSSCPRGSLAVSSAC